MSDGLCELPAPSIPPPQLRCFLSAYGSLLTVLRREPEAVAALQRIRKAYITEKATFVPQRLVPAPDQESDPNKRLLNSDVSQ